jgi:hypothetical protein
MSGNRVQDHYAGDDTGSGMASRILAAVRSVHGREVAVTPEALARLDHQWAWVGGDAGIGSATGTSCGRVLAGHRQWHWRTRAMDRDAVRLHGDRRGCDRCVL